MSPSRVPKILIAVSLVAVALGYLIYTASRSNLVYYYEIAEARASVQPHQQVRLSGDVVEGTIHRSGADPAVRFEIEDATRRNRLPVVYSGVVPDIFKPGIQVVVEGRFDEAGTFQAERLTAKCPSKYQAAGDLKKTSPPAPEPSAAS
jgi:cytochrome c-type biogenesis protein CcmE